MLEPKEPLGKQPIVPTSDQLKVSHAGKLSMWLDDYNDIFSDFDPRPYAQRTLSEDFLFEAKRESRETVSGNYGLYLLMPHNKRNLYHEAIIKKRLKQHFKKQHDSLLDKKRRIFNQGLFFVELGVVLMLVTTFLLVRYEHANFFLTFLAVIAEPGGWFLFWEGLSLLVFGAKEIKPELEFNKKMAKASIHFGAY
ncbi:hypothetical protein A3A67_00735 [Candidatus Peribacteria bacterium RIFCSPLOWO2_01_FULL_51_18]|nr:MAG: hypothetical protein A3A67_00735 [Candidatus Peribacteria bacterium RIFCSPLOWO2_01_FULL_51_18]